MGTISFINIPTIPLPGYQPIGDWEYPDNAVEETGIYQGMTNVLSTSASPAWSAVMTSALEIAAGASFTVLLDGGVENVAVGLYVGSGAPPQPSTRYTRDKHAWVVNSGGTSTARPQELASAVGTAFTYSSVGQIVPWVIITSDGTKLEYKYSTNNGTSWTTHFTSTTYSALDAYRIDLCLRWGGKRAVVYYKPSYT